MAGAAAGNIARSTSAQTMWAAVMWTCWMIGVQLEGARRMWSQRGSILPPPCPANPSVVRPLARAASSAQSTLGELPEVEMARNTSPGLPSAITWRSNTWS